MRIADTGTLEACRSADFIVVEHQPVRQSPDTRRITAVYLLGAVVMRAQ
jgi:imidazolonepropionase-like amidohydrolase